MNSSKPIEISKSSLLSLKAEILRKQHEVANAKPHTKVQTTRKDLKTKTKKETCSESQNKGVEGRQAKDEIEDEDLLLKSRKILENKTKLYNKLSKGPSNFSEEENEFIKRYLVQFDKKTCNECPEVDSDEGGYKSDDYEPAKNTDEEWVEYVDCLGRTRTCLRKDLEYIQENDKELSKSLDPEHKGHTKEQTKLVIDEQGNTDKNKENVTEQDSCIPSKDIYEDNELLSSDMRRELLRRDWEKQEEDLLNKKNIHYQDLLFNEARSHGVGYYAFSKDEEARAMQQKELNKLREQTEQQQRAAMEQKQLRERQMATRLKAARNRKRARMGLPPEEDEPEAPILEVKPDDEKEKRKALEKEKEEKEKQSARSRIIRPWDIGKEGLKKHYEHSQEEWVEKKRKERQKEFAPPTLYRTNFLSRKAVSDEDVEKPDKSLYFTSRKFKKNVNIPVHPSSLPSPKISIDSYISTSISEQSSLETDFQETTKDSELTNLNGTHTNSSGGSKSSNDTRRNETGDVPPLATYDSNKLDRITSRKNEHFERFSEDSYNITKDDFQPTKIIDECNDFDQKQQKYSPSDSESSDDEVQNKRTEIPPPATYEYYEPNSSTRKVPAKSKQNLEESIAAGLKFLREQAEKKQKSAQKRKYVE